MLIVISGSYNEGQEVMQAGNADVENAGDLTGVIGHDDNAQDNDNEQYHQPRSSYSCQ